MDYATLKMGNESDLTYELKLAAWQWLYSEARCRAIGMEARLEGPFGRIVDLVGLGPKNVVYIVEVKSSRADLLRDDNTEADRRRIRSRRKALQEAADLTSQILDSARSHAVHATQAAKTLEENAQATSSLLASPPIDRAKKDTPSDTDDNDWRENRTYRFALKEHQEATRKVDRNRQRVATLSTKFHDPAFLACADYHYIMAPQGIISTAELPPFWGLLNQNAETVAEAPPKQVQRNTAHVLRAIAKANTRDLMKLCRIGV